MLPAELGLLRCAVGLCSRSAVAYKAAYMLAAEDGAEAALLACCTARYALLERLLGLLVEHSVRAGQVRHLLDGIDMDPARYCGSIDRALCEARESDAGLGFLAASALGEGELPATIASCLRDLAVQVGAKAAAAPGGKGLVMEAEPSPAGQPRYCG